MPAFPTLSPTFIAVSVFALVYLGMVLGGWPRLQLDRTGVALLGAIAIVGAGVLTPEAAAQAIHLPTIVLLFSFMVMSAQMRLGGFYARVTQRLAALPVGPAAWLAWVIAAAAALSAVFTNDIVCLAMAPLLAETCVRRRLDPVPYLLALACASNIGSALTLIGNPQNMLIGSVLSLSFAEHLRLAWLPVLLSLAFLWAWLARGLGAAAAPPANAAAGHDDAEPPFDRWQSAKGLAVAGALVLVFLFTPWPREVAALVGAGLLLLSRRFHSSRVMSLVDWELLVLFMGLFVVNHALQASGALDFAVQRLQAGGLDFGHDATLGLVALLLSNVVSNVPAVMLLLPVTGGSEAGSLLALVSTLAGNLVIVGSIANIIVVDAARRHGVTIDWRRHARTGVPVTLGTLAILALCWAWRPL